MKYACLPLIFCFVLSLSCNNTAQEKPSKKERPLYTCTDTCSIAFSEGDTLAKLSRGLNSLKKPLHINPTVKARKEINSWLGSTIISPENDTSDFLIQINKKQFFRCSYFGKTAGYYIFYAADYILLLNPAKDERYAFSLSPGMKFNIQAVFYLNDVLMPVFSIKNGSKHPNVPVFAGFEAYPYDTGKSFTILAYQSDHDLNKYVGSLKAGELKGLHDKLSLIKPEIRVSHIAYSMFNETPLWEDSGGFYLFRGR